MNNMHHTPHTRHSGPYIERAVVAISKRRHVPLSVCAEAAGYRRTSMFRRCMRAGDCTTMQLESIAAALGTTLPRLAATASREALQ